MQAEPAWTAACPRRHRTTPLRRWCVVLRDPAKKRPKTVLTSQQGPSAVEVPAAYDGLLPLPAEQADRGGGERQECPGLRAEPDPAGGENAQQVPVGEDDRIAAGVAQPGDHPVGTRSHLRRG